MTPILAIADNAYFAQHAVFPGVNDNLTAPGTPWILYGGSLAGAQTAFSVKTYGDILFGGIASSGTVLAELDYPDWYVACGRISRMSANRALRTSQVSSDPEVCSFRLRGKHQCNRG